MATGNGRAPDEEGASQCRVDDSFRKRDEPNLICAVATESDPCEGSSGAALGLQTYKRRKLLVNSSSATRSLQDGAVHLEIQNSKELHDRGSEGPVFEQVHVSTTASHMGRNDFSDSSHGQWCKLVLDQISQSLSEDGGIVGCIRKAIQHSTENDNMKIKGSVSGIEGKPGLDTEAGWTCNGVGAKGFECTSNGYLDESNQQSTTESCQRAFYNVIISGKFNLLCKLLCENFEGSKIDGLLDFELINSRMTEGVYEHSPARFSSDFEKVWRKLQEIGVELHSLAKSLGGLSRISCHEYVGKATDCTSGEENNEVHLHNPLCDTKLERAEDGYVSKVCACRRCGERAYGRECLICDSCEDMYHVFCTEPAVGEIPPRSWYCAQCISNGKRPTHENCVVCKRMFGERATLTDTKKDLSHSADDNRSGPIKSSFGLCSICGSDMFEDEIIRDCSHSLCAHGSYHERCLSTKQLKSYGPCWYCPSCLCRTCLCDRDDDKIILCDACDYAYHIYCVKPPLSKIPAGKWFCTKCEAGLQAILRVKRACEGVKVKGKRGRKKKIKERSVTQGKGKRMKEKVGEESDKVGGGMDMLLNAAKTLNIEEDLAAAETKS